MKIALPCIAVVALAAGSASAQVVGYVNNPSGNSTDFRNGVANLGGIIDEQVDFETHPIGALQPNWYAGLGVTINSNVNLPGVQSSAGPGQGNVNGQQPGEGINQVSRILFSNGTPSVVTISFDEPIFGAGIFTIDKFSGTQVSLNAYDGPDGQGNLLGSFVDNGQNFQQNRLYFMGITSGAGDIRSITLSHAAGGGDQLAYDRLLIGRIPAPGAAGLLAMAGLAAARRRR